MTLVLAGTVPVDRLPVTYGHLSLEGGKIRVGDVLMPVGMGTAGMLAAATATCHSIGLQAPVGVVAGDLGLGDGSEELYKFLAKDLVQLEPTVLTLHYVLPIRGLFLEFVEALPKMSRKPVIIADAGFMYAAKATRVCEQFDLFTPDIGELAFLADHDADHPAYVLRVLWEEDVSGVPRLVQEAYRYRNASKVLLVKGSVDFVAERGEVVATVSEPRLSALEAVGGTGDIVTGVVSALVYFGLDLVQASIKAARVSRLAGVLASATPATQISEIIPRLAEALRQVGL